MPGRSQDAITKPVVVVRRRSGAKSPGPPTKPTVTHSPSPAAEPIVSSPSSTPITASAPPASQTTPVPKPPQPPEDPAAIAARRAQRFAAVQAVLKELMTRWPQTFTAHPVPVRPLASGIGKVVKAYLPDVPRRLVSDAIAFWQRQRKTPYLQALIAGGPRYDLEGNPHGEVTPEQQEQARTDLIAWRTYRQAKRRALAQRSTAVPSREDKDTGNAPSLSITSEESGAKV